MNALIEKILAHDPSAMQLAQQLGSFAAPMLRPLVDNADEDVRELAMRCLNESDSGESLSDLATTALTDNAPMVRAAALNALDRHLPPESYAKLLQIFSEVEDPQHRKEIALLIGRLSNASPEDLKRLLQDELISEVREGGLAALAKLGDSQARREFLERLSRARDRELKQLLEYVEYIKQLWALRGLMPVLADKTPLAGSGFCQILQGAGSDESQADKPIAAVRDRIAEILRACDIAVNLIKKIAGAKFPFPTGAKNYADEELAAARQILAALLSQQR